MVDQDQSVDNQGLNSSQNQVQIQITQSIISGRSSKAFSKSGSKILNHTHDSEPTVNRKDSGILQKPDSDDGLDNAEDSPTSPE